MIAQSILFAAETAIIHRMGPSTSVMLLALLRGAAGLTLAIALARGIGWRVVRTDQFPLQIARGAVSLLYLWVMVYSFGRLPFADATAISYTQVAYIGLFSLLILNESVGAVRWVAASFGMLGALLIANPEFNEWNNSYMLALCGACLNGLSFVLNRFLQRRDSETTTMFYTSAVLVLGNVPALVLSPLPTSDSLMWLPGILVCGPLGTYLGIIAVKHATTAILGPYTLVRLLVCFIAGILVFEELPSFASILGAVCIVTGCLLSLQPFQISSNRLIAAGAALRLRLAGQ